MSWLKKGLIFKNRCLYDWDITHAQVPVVDRISQDRLRIYYASRDRKGRSNMSFIEVQASNPAKIFYEHSSPLLSFGKLGAFDESGIMPTSIIDMGEKKYLYYIGWSQRKTVPYQNSIGLAVSSDNGISFEKISEGPIIGVNHIDPYFTGTFYVLKEKNLLRGYYLSCVGWEIYEGKLEPLYKLKYAESHNGISWKREGKIAIDFFASDEGGLASASVINDSGKYKMWYGKRKKSHYRTDILSSYRIGYAESADGVYWTRKDSLAGIDISSSGWDSEMISYPNVINVGGQLTMFYNGNGFGRSGFGYAIQMNDK